MNLKKIVEISYALMDKSDFKKRCRHFSFICSGKRILSIGLNNSKTQPINLNFDYVNRQKKYIRDVVGTHSEINAVLKIGKENCVGKTIINTRINRKNELDISKPCNGCMDMIMKLGFQKVIYSNKNKEFEKIVFKKGACK